MQAPDGIVEKQTGARLWDRHASPLAILLLAGILACALGGLAGGQPSPAIKGEFGAAKLSVKTPATLRNGEFFETRIEIAPDIALADAQLGIGSDLWRDITINSMIPAASEERFQNGEYRFSYGALAAGEALKVKIDGQINPPLFAGTAGDVALYDGDKRIGQLKLRIRVLP
jgi:hypothetical protein